jgi:hypothetical protein
MKKRLLIFLTPMIVLMFFLSACSAVSDIKLVNDTGKAFMTALQNSDSASSWKMLTPAIQEEVGGEEAWAEWISIRNFPKWSFNNTEVSVSTGRMDGTAELDGEQYIVSLGFEKSDETWLISGINFEASN